MTRFSNRNRKARTQASFERRERWSRSRLLATTGLGGALAGLALGGGNAWGQVGPNTLPQNGQVVAGQATISQQGQNTLNVNQSSNRAIINWSSFDVGQDATVNFHQPNSGSWTVNRVTAGQSASQILGSVNANGNIVVVNPNGVIFGQGSRIDVNGIIATTSNISNQNFMSGNMKFDQAGNPNAMIVNQGEITVRDAGLVAFVAPGVSNSGTITANLGRVSLASGNKFTVDLYGDKLVSIAVDGGTNAAPVGPDGKPVDALVSNSGQILAAGGRVQMTAQQASAIVDNAINMSGVVRAQSAYTAANGDIVLDAGPNGNVVVSGTLDVSGKGAGQTGGTVTVTGKNDVTIASTAKIDASGAAGGGKVKIGGDWQGKGATPTARNTNVAAGAKIDASAIDNGNGGTVVVWADDTTMYSGDIAARGGANGGNGGFAEVSGKNQLAYLGTADLRAPNGAVGKLLLDPGQFTISATTASGVGILLDDDLTTQLGSADVEIRTSTQGTGGGNGVITVENNATVNFGTNTLTLVADDAGGVIVSTGVINIGSSVSFTNGSLELQAGTVNLGSELGVTILDAGVNAASLVNVTGNTAGIIADAIDIVGSGGTVDLQNATYNESITIDKSLTLTSTLGAPPTINGAATTSTIEITASNVTVSDLSIAPAAATTNAIHIAVGASNVIVEDNAIAGANASVGVLVEGAGAIVRNNAITGTASHGIHATSVTGGFTASGNTITTTVNVGANGIYVVSPTGSLVLSGNTIDDVANTGIQIDTPVGTNVNTIQVSNNVIGGDTLNPIGGAGLIINAGSGFLGTTSISGNVINVGGAVGSTGAISLQEMISVVINSNTLQNIGASGAQGIAIVGTGATAGNYTISSNSATGNTISGFTTAGIAVADTDAFAVGTATTVFFNGPNVISMPGTSSGLVFFGTGTRIGNSVATRTLGQMTFLRPGGATGSFVVLAGGALFAGSPAPANPTVISAADALFDVNSNGAIDAAELDLGNFNPANIDTQTELDDFWNAGGVAANAALVEAAITDFSDDGTLGRISVLGADVTLVTAGGLEAIQNAIDASTAGGYVFVDAGVFGSPSPDGSGTTPALTIDKSLFLYGRQAFVSATDGTRTAGGANESVLDFADADADPVATVGGIIITASAVTVRGFDIVSDAVNEDYGIRVDGNRTNIIIANNFIHGFNGNGIDNTGGSLTVASIIGNNIYDVGNSGIELSFGGSGGIVVDTNFVRAGAGWGISLSSSSATKPLTVSSNTVQTAGLDGIAINNFGLTVVDSNVVNSSIGTDLIGGDAIVITGGGGGLSRVTNNVIGGGAVGFQIEGSGINFDGPGSGYSVASNTITNVGTAEADSAGIRIFAGNTNANFSILNNEITSVGQATGDGIAIINDNSGNFGATLSGNTIENVGDAGISVIDGSPTLNDGITSVVFGAGNVVDAAVRGLFFSGADTRSQDSLGNRTFNDLVLGSVAGSITGNFIELQNAALHGNPNGTPFTPLSYDASGVTFNDQDVTLLDPTNLADRQTLADIEGNIVHYLDTTLADYNAAPVRNMRGLIRLKTDSFSLDDSSGLNAIQLAVSASNSGDTIYLVAGNYGDQSDLLDTINDYLQGVSIGTAGNDYLYIDRSLTIIGVQDGTSAADPTRQPFNAANESVLDFLNATESNDGGVVIAANNVTIDGVAVLADGDQPFGIRIDTTLAKATPTSTVSPAALSGISIVNSFVLGNGIAGQIAGHGIDRVGSDSISNLNISDNAIDFVTQDAVNLTFVRGLTIQNNLVGQSSPAIATVGDDGFDLSNITYATSVSGNSIFATVDDGMFLDNTSLGATDAANAVTIVDNTVSGVGGDGIEAMRFRTISVLSNTVGIAGFGTGANGVYVHDTSGQVIVGADSATGNTIDDTGLNGVFIENTGVSVGTGGVLVSHNQIGQTGDIGIDTVTSAGGNGIFINNTAAGNVTVRNNLVGNATIPTTIFNGATYDGDGISIRGSGANVSVHDNSVVNAEDDGIEIVDVGLTVQVVANEVALVGAGTDAGDGIVVHNTGTVSTVGNLNGSVTVIGNTVSGVTGDGAADQHGNRSSGDGIRVTVVDGDVIVGNDGNTVTDADDDGIEIGNAMGSVSSSNNTITNVSNSTTTGDGIVVYNIGNAYAGAGSTLVNVYVSGNTITDVNGDGTQDTLGDALSAGDGIRVSNVDGTVTVIGNTIQSIGNDGIQAYNINRTVLVDGNLLSTISELSDTGDGIVVENTGGYSFTDGVGQGGSVTIVSNSISNVLGGADLDTDTISAGGQSLSSGDGIRVGAIDGEVLIGGASGTGNTVTNVAGDGIQVFHVTGEDGVDNTGVSIGFNAILTVGTGSGGDLDGDGIQVSRTGTYGGAAGNFTGDVNVFNNTVNDVQSDLSVDRDDGFTSGDGVRVVQADGHVTVSANEIGAGASAADIDNDGIQIHTVTRSVLATGNTVGTTGAASIGTGGGNAHGDGIVIESTGTLSGAAHAVAGEGSVVVTSNTVVNVLGDGTDDTDVATVPVAGLDSALTSGDGIRVDFADGLVSVDTNTVTNVGDDGIQVFAVTGNGASIGGVAVSVTGNIVTTAGVAAVGGDGIVISYTGAFVTDPTGTAADFNGGVLVQGNTVNDVVGDGADDDDDRTAGDGIRVVSADGDVSVLSNTVANSVGGDIDNDGIQVWDVTRAVTVSSNLVGSANASIGVGTVGTSDGDGIVIENTGFFSSYGESIATDFVAHVVVTSNTVTNVVGAADLDADGYNPNGGPGATLPDIDGQNAPNEFLSSGDGVRVAYVDGQATVSSNIVDTTAGDGIQAYYIAGLNSAGATAVFVLNNTVNSVGNTPVPANADGDGIVVSFTGGFGLGLAPTVGTNTGGGGVLIQGNTVNGVIGNGPDRDDARSSGDGIRVRSANGFVSIDTNTIGSTADIDNDGIQVWDVTHSVTVNANLVGSAAAAIGTGASADGDGIVVENTGIYTTGGGTYGTSGEGDVVVTSNVVQNVLGDGTADADGAVTDIVGGANNDPVQFLTAGDGIRVGFVNGDVTVGGTPATGNTVTNVGDDGIQIYAVDGIGGAVGGPAVLITDNRVSLTSAVGTTGDGIVVSYTGLFVSDAGGTAQGADGLVHIFDNTVDDVGGDGADADDGRTAGDGIRVRSADTGVEIDGNFVATQAGGTIANDGIQVWDVKGSVTVNANTVGTAATVGTGASGDGDGIVVENVGGPFSTRGSGSGTGSAYVTNNIVRNVGGSANTETLDGSRADFVGQFAGADPVQFLSSGDGIRVAFVSDQASVTGNIVDNVTNDGVQAYMIRGIVGDATTAVSIVNNTITNVGNGTVGGQQDGDGIAVAFTGEYVAGGLALGGGVLVQGNIVDDVAAAAQVDRDDGRTAGDGVRVRSADGGVSVLGNSIGVTANIANDGVQIADVTRAVTVDSNTIGSAGSTIGSSTVDGDGIVVEDTGQYALAGATLSPVQGQAEVTITNNTVTNVAGDGTFDRDGPVISFSAGDGIRASRIDGALTVGTNTLTSLGDDGIQLDTIAGSVTVSANVIDEVGGLSTSGDGIIISDVGNAYDGSIGPSGVVVIVADNVISDVNGDGEEDIDDNNFSTGDGIRIVRVDGSVQTLRNSIARVDDDGIYIGVIRQTVLVQDNNLLDMGLNSDTGDGIVVALTGTLAGGVAGAGGVTILNNTVTNVNADTPAAPDFDNPDNFFGGKNAGFSAGDGIRAENIDGNLVVGNGSATGNSIINVDDDGIQIDTVRGSVTALFNRISTVGVDGNLGDGIAVADVGAAYAGGTTAGVLVNVSNNTILSVNGDGLADPDDAQHSNGDGVRIVRVDGSAQSSTNTITGVDDDGIYVGVVRGSVNVLNNRLNSIGAGSATGDGIVVAVTGEYAGGAADGGDVTINGNSIANVDPTAPGSLDFDNPGGVFGGLNAGRTSGDGIRVEYIDGNAVIGVSGAGNSIQNVDDDGVQAFSLTGATTISFNSILDVANDGTDSASGDGIQVNFTGQYASLGFGAVGDGDVIVSNNSIVNVQNSVGNVPLADDPEDLQTSGDGIRLHQISGDATVNSNLIDPIGDDGIQIGNVDFSVTSNNNTITDIGVATLVGDGIVIFNTGIVGANDGNGSVTVNGNTITNIGGLGTGAADPDDGGYTANDGIRIVVVDGAVVAGSNTITNTRDDGIQVADIERSVNVTSNVIATVGAGSNLGDGIVVHNTGANAASIGPAGSGDVTVSGNSVTNVTGNGGADVDDGLTAGDGIRVSLIDGDAVIATNVIQTVGDDGIQAFGINDSVSVTGNRVTLAGNISTTGDGIAVEEVGTAGDEVVVLSGNTIADIRGDGNVANVDSGGLTTENDGIRVEDILAAAVTVDANVVTDVGDDGVEVASIAGPAAIVVTNNALNSIGTGAGGLGDGIIVTAVAGSASVGGNTVSNVLSANGGAADNVDGYTAGDGIRVSDISLNATVGSNTVANAADDGIQARFVAGALSVLSNRVNSVSNVSTTGDGVDVTEIAGNVTINANTITAVFGDGTADPDGSGLSSGDGIRVELTTGTVLISGNSIGNVGDDGIQVHLNPDDVTASGNRVDDFGNLTAGAGDGIVITETTGNVVANNNSVSNGNGTDSDIDDMEIAGDGIRIVRTTGNVEANGNNVSNVAETGIQIFDTGGIVNANNNNLTGVLNFGIAVVRTGGALTVSGNSLANNGDGIPGVSALGDDTGIYLEDFASAVVTNNTIVNVTPGSLTVGIDIGKTTVGPVLITMTGNSISDSGTGLFIRDNVMGTVSTNTFTNNVVWGVQIDNTVSGNAIGLPLPGDPVPTIDILFRDNFLNGNGAPAPGDGVTRGGINNLNPGPNPGGFIFDARGNNFNGQPPFTTGTHFENPNTGGGGDAVSDWVRIDIPLRPNIIVPYYDFGSLLDNLGRGGDAETPGDVLAIGPHFDRNGHLFDPYFVNVFGTPFGLSGDAVQSLSDATQYAMCYLSDMWKVTSCRKGPSGN